ncbi:MAG: terpene cyclase/mutase family protein [Isosphaeraceae bacterium]|nr:terpene cyclase/mutase family protein [Isosphaeraceae bacterium]
MLGLVAAGAWLAGCRRREVSLAERIDRAEAWGMGALIRAQSPDGAWRSPTYGVFRDGLSLTPPVLKAIAFGPDVPGAATARRRGAAYLAARLRTDGSIDDGPFGLIYPVYTASAAAIALGRVEVPGGREARAAWLRELWRRQLTDALGWGPDDPAYGAWGYAIEPPVKGEAQRRRIDADLSSSLFAIGALKLAGVPVDDPALRAAILFIQRCQNLSDDGQMADPRFDDGGFFFTPIDPVRNKAGEAGTDREGRLRYSSYGSATADGLRALLRCGLPPDHPRVAAAQRWLEQHFSATTNPGTFAPPREVERDATYYYYAWSVAHAFRALSERGLMPGGQASRWAEGLARELIHRQRDDGTWSNRLTASKEDDPLIATSFAVGALALARGQLR